MVLNSLQEQSHVASLLGYSSPGELSAGLALPPTPDRPTGSVSSNSEAPDHLHLAEVLLKTLLLSIGFYTVSLLNILKITQRMLISFYLPPKMFRIVKPANYMLMLFSTRCATHTLMKKGSQSKCFVLYYCLLFL